MWSLPYSKDTIDIDLTDEDGAAERVLQDIQNRRTLYDNQNPDMADIFSQLSWELEILGDGPPDEIDRPSGTR
eukprot:9066962-Karenia_brevis.AAC.1